jgi:hypothetical protein
MVGPGRKPETRCRAAVMFRDCRGSMKGGSIYRLLWAYGEEIANFWEAKIDLEKGKDLQRHVEGLQTRSDK